MPLLLSVKAQESYAPSIDPNEYVISFCDVCTNTSLFMAYAKSQDKMGHHIIVNPKSFVMKGYRVYESWDINGDIVTYAVPFTLPSELNGLMEELKSLDTALNTFRAYGETPVSSSFDSKSLSNVLNAQSFSPNGCGSTVGGGWAYVEYFATRGIEFPFYEACNKHDMCYANNVESKTTCDSNFYGDMLQEINQLEGGFYYYLYGIVGSKIIKKFHILKAKAFYRTVANSNRALEAYCGSKDSTFDDCKAYFNGSSSGGSKVGSTSTPGSSGGYTYVTKCDLYQLPDGKGGFYYMYLNCTVTTLGF